MSCTVLPTVRGIVAVTFASLVVTVVVALGVAVATALAAF